MLTCLIRTAIIYLLLVLAIRTTGKRQIGELEISELVSTFLLSEIASAPIGNQEIPLSFAVFPILIIICLEVIVSFLAMRFPLMKKLFLGSPIILIRRGKLRQKELTRARMTVEELLSELRQNGVASIEEVAYAILENNGKLSVTPKADQKPLTPTDLRLQIQEKGIAHAVIVDGIVKKEVLNSTGRNRDWLDKVLRQNHCSLPEVFLLTVDDSGHVHIIPKEQ